MQEKSLIKVEKLNIFQKIGRFLKNLFNKNNIEEKLEVQNIKQESNIISELRDKQNTTNLQKKYENGEISEELISEEDKEKLVELYNEQIKALKDNVLLYKNSLRNYKQRILEIREKVESNN